MKNPGILCVGSNAPGTGILERTMERTERTQERTNRCAEGSDTQAGPFRQTDCEVYRDERNQLERGPGDPDKGAIL